MKKGNNLISVFLFTATFLFIVSISISLPIFLRPFYYAHIDAYSLPESSGFTKDEIIEAYDETLDYLTRPDITTFSAGCMKFSSDGAEHFRDCKKLFTLNSAALLLSAFTIILILFLRKSKKITLSHFIGHSPVFWSGITVIFSPLILGLLISLNPDRAFVIFHKIFFPGKDNWIFNPRTDEIISVLPQQFFFNCAILIGAGMIILSAICILLDLFSKGRHKH